MLPSREARSSGAMLIVTTYVALSRGTLIRRHRFPGVDGGYLVWQAPGRRGSSGFL